MSSDQTIFMSIIFAFSGLAISFYAAIGIEQESQSTALWASIMCWSAAYGLYAIGSMIRIKIEIPDA